MTNVQNPFHHHKVKKLREKAGLLSSFQKTVVYGAAVFILMNFLLVFRMTLSSTVTPTATSNRNASDRIPHQRGMRHKNKKLSSTPSLGGKDIQCHFRQYPPRRYYGLNKLEQPDFLSKVDYIYGEYPILLTPSESNLLDYKSQGKLCVDQSGWLPKEKNDRTKELPFADGTNPSILSLDRLLQEYSDLHSQFTSLGGKFIATLCMTDSQCSYNDSKEEIKQFKLSSDEKATVIQTELLLLDEHFQTLLQATIYLERDAQWGRKYKPQKDDKGHYNLQAFALDDARLFIHHNRLWVSYREGPSFGYEQQVLNEIHLDYDAKEKKLNAIIKASESASFCCGRNMALMERLDKPDQLQSLTWADPVTVVDVDTTPKTSQKQRQRRRQLGEGNKKKKSHFHGTNQFMIYLPKTDEFLGIGHFHRPHSRDAFNPYARFGHHYTHTFYTISSQEPFHLKRLSQEFVLPSKSQILQDDADIIQFLSGLEVIKLDGKDWAVIAYGINDCEGAAIYLEMDRIEELLKLVPDGKEVVDLMSPLTSGPGI